MWVAVSNISKKASKLKLAKMLTSIFYCLLYFLFKRAACSGYSSNTGLVYLSESYFLVYPSANTRSWPISSPLYRRVLACFVQRLGRAGCSPRAVCSWLALAPWDAGEAAAGLFVHTDYAVLCFLGIPVTAFMSKR